MTAPDRDAALLSTGTDRPDGTATFGIGCFWGPDARFGALQGVVRTRVGYAGGTDPNPTYTSLGGHTEVTRIEFDPATLSYEDLLTVFWAHHDPFGSARKHQYRSVVLVHDEAQRAVAERTRDELADRTGKSVATTIETADEFTLAEDYHQKYELRSTPVVGDELRTRLGDGFVDSTIAARLNGFVAGHGTEAQCGALLDELDLPENAVSEVRRRR